MNMRTDSTTTEIQARTKAELLLAKLRPYRFKARVWENRGWHYAVGNKFLSVSPSAIGDEFVVMFVPHYSYLGDVVRYRNPAMAVHIAVEQYEKFVEGHLITLEKMKKSLKA